MTTNLRALVEQLADALDAVLNTAHPVSPTTSRYGGAGGMTITMHCDLQRRPEIVEQAYVALQLANRDANWWSPEIRERLAVDSEFIDPIAEIMRQDGVDEDEAIRLHALEEGTA